MKTSATFKQPAHRPVRAAGLVALLLGTIACQLFVPRCAFALDPDKSIFQFNCRNWSRQNGLPADKINSIAQGKDGYIWLGTQNGLVRFDGDEFKKIPINLPSARGQDVRNVIVSKDATVHFAVQRGGFGSYDGRQFLSFGDDRWALSHINANTVIESRDGAIWTGADLAVGRWLKEKPEASLFISQTNCAVLSLCEDPSGTVWFGTIDRGVFYVADGKTVPFPVDELKGQNVYALAVDAQKQIWVGMGSGLRCFYPNGQARDIPRIDYEVKALLLDRHGVLWVATTTMGLGRYANGKLDFFKKIDGLGGDNVTSLFEDAEGSLWVGTENGLSQLSDVKFPIFTGKEWPGMESATYVAADLTGGVWVTHNNGVSHFDGRTSTNYSGEPLFLHPYLKLVLQARNGGAYAVDGLRNIDVFSEGRLLTRYTNDTWTDTLAEDSQGILAGMGEHLFRIQDGRLQPYVYQDGREPVYYWINNLCVASDQSIWLASNNGIFQLRDGICKQWSMDNGLSGSRVQYIFVDTDGSVWAGLDSGLARVKNGQVKNITRQNGLPDNRIFAVIPDDHGSFWCDSGRGIFRVSRQGLNDFADDKTNRVDCELFDGLESVKSVDRTYQGNSGCKTADGRIWFPCPSGVVMIDPGHLAANPVPPSVHLEQMLANGREFDCHSNAIVPAGKGELEFHFTGLSFIAPEKIRFRYQLEGYDKEWVESSGRRLAFYTNLKPGRYTFRVTAANADGVWDDAGYSINIELRPHFYQTAWFYLLCGLLVCAMLAGIYAWRMRHLRRRQRALQQARDLLETQVVGRTAELAAANASLQTEAGEHQRTAVKLAQRTHALEKEIEERKRMQLEIERVHCELLDISRQAGMAEVATNVLHNVGNVLNSVNVSAAVVADNIKNSKTAYVTRAAALLNEHAADLGTFMTADPKGRQLPAFLNQLAGQMTEEQQNTLKELDLLRQNIEHIKEIVAMQQSYAGISGVTETVKVTDLVEDALRMNAGGLTRHQVELVREYGPVPPVTVQKHKVLQILVNLIRNAKHACDDSGRKDKQIKIRVYRVDDRIQIEVQDNGVGIPPENLARIFNHGFTTRKGGHGFGLHSGALAARELGGVLCVHSDGHGRGAIFSLKLPLQPAMGSNPDDSPAVKSAASPDGPGRHPALAGIFVATLLAACLPATRSLALDPEKNIYQYNCQTWSQRDGLPANGVNAIAQTDDGYLWLGASAGLIRFDGLNFFQAGMSQTPGLRTTEVLALTPSDDGGLWFGLKASAYGQYDRQGRWNLAKESVDNIAWDVPCLLKSKDGRLWIGGDNPQVRTPDGRFQRLQLVASSKIFVNCFAEDSHGRIWAGASRGLFYLDQGRWLKFAGSDFDGAIVNVLAEDKQGRLWVGSDLGLFCYNAKGKRMMAEYPGKIYALLVDHCGALWAGTFGRGLLHYYNGEWSSLKKADGLADDLVLSLAEDKEGSIWVGTRGGLSQLADVKFPTFGLKEGLITDIALGVSASPRGGLWVGTQSGAAYFDGRMFNRNTATNSDLYTRYAKRVLEDRNGDVYVLAGRNMIEIYADGILVSRHLTADMPVALTEDAAGVIVSVGRDLFRVNREHLTPISFRNDIKPDLYWVVNLAVGRDGSILVACVNGICRIKTDGTFEQWTLHDGLADSQGRWVLEDADGTIWAGLSTGIARIRGREIHNIRRENGLFDGNISSIIPDDNGAFWVDSNRGIFCVTRQSLNDFADGKTSGVTCVSYDGGISVKSADKYGQEQSACRTKDGRIWFPSVRGLIMVNPTNIPVNPLPPPVHIASARANNRQLILTNGINIPPGNGELEFQFNALSYIGSQNLRFSYRLDGYDQEWVEAEHRRLAAYNNLKPGHYTFRVIAANMDGIWNQTGDSLTFTLLPHFYQTLWFYLLCGGLAAAALGGLYAGRVQHLERQQQALLEARDLLESQVVGRTAELAAANDCLQQEEVQLKQRTHALEKEIEERKRMQLEIERVHRELLETSRQAGMAEVATNVLHNVGNVLNSVNVSAAVVADNIKNSKTAYVTRAAALLNEHAADLGTFMTTDPKGRQLPAFLNQLAGQMTEEQQNTLKELDLLRQNIEHIKEIVAMQQSYARISGVTETVNVTDLVEDALRMNAGALARHQVELIREYADLPPVNVQKHKVLQILVNLIRNAKYACDDSGRKDKKMTVRVSRAKDGVQIEVIDNGVGIPPENLARIFNHGFTTRKNGHGFGLHSGALAARELGGELAVQSGGHGQGAIFTLKLPIQPPPIDL